MTVIKLTDAQKLKVIRSISGVMLLKPFPEHYATLSEEALLDYIADHRHLIFRDSMTPKKLIQLINILAVAMFQTLEQDNE